MSFFGLFHSKKEKKVLSHIKNLWEVAVSDQHFDEKEKAFLYDVGKRYHIGKRSVDKVCESPESVSFMMPESAQEKFEQLYDLVSMMMIDGKIDQRETITCRQFAENINITVDSGKVEELVYYISQNVLIGNSLSETLKRVGYMIK